MHKRVLVVTTEMLPPFSAPCAGGGVRAWSLGEALRARGHDVEYAIPEPVLRDRPVPGGLVVHPYNFWRLNEMVLRVSPDVLLFEQWFPLSYLRPVSIPVIVDLPGPLILENWYRGVGTAGTNAMVKLRALARADLYLHATARQRAYWMAWLPLAGAAPDEDRLLYVPIQLDPHRPTPGARPAELTVVYAGLFWAWQKPAEALAAVVETMEAKGRGHCVVIGGRHPDHAIEGEQYAELPPALAGASRLAVHDPVPFTELVDALRQCHLAIDVGPENAERRLSSNIRTAVYLWAGLPVVVSDHCYLADDIAAYGAGWVVPGAGGRELRRLVERLLERPEELAEKREGAQRLARERLSWDALPAALLRFVERPTPRAKQPPLLAEAVDKVETLDRQLEDLRQECARLDAERFRVLEELHDVRHELGAIRGRLLFRLENRLRGLLGKPAEIPPRPRPAPPAGEA